MRAPETYRLCCMLLIITFLISLDALAATWYVPDQYPAIQGAIDSSAVNAGDTVIVRRGTYYENIRFNGKEITLRSEEGAATTVIDGHASGSVVSFNSSISAHPTLEGFTLRNGKSNYGGGIYCRDQVYPNIIDCIITGNSSVNSGGGIYCHTETSPYFTGCIITGNTTKRGGGVYCQTYVSPSFTNCIIAGNSATVSGGGIYCAYYSYLDIVNCTLAENSAASDGGGVYASLYSSVSVTNSIIWANTAGSGPDGIYDSQSSVNVNHSNIQGGWPGVGNLYYDPFFVDPTNNDFHIIAYSPCRNSGDNSAAFQLTDFEGDPRIADGTVDMGADEFYTHLYWTGDATPGGDIKVKFVGYPGPYNVALCLSTGALQNSIPTNWGDWWNDWWLQFPIVGPVILGTLPSEHVFVFSYTLPLTPPGPYTIYMQAFIGDSLTNLCEMVVE